MSSDSHYVHDEERNITAWGMVLPFGAAGYVVGKKGCHIKKIQKLPGVSNCSIVNKYEQSIVAVAGTPAAVEKAICDIKLLIAQYIAQQSRQIGYAPLFSLFVIDLPITNNFEDDNQVEYSFRMVPQKIQTQLDKNDMLRILKSYTVTTTTSCVPRPFYPDTFTSQKQFVAGYDMDQINLALAQMYKKIDQQARTIQKLDFVANVGNTFVQPKGKINQYDRLSLDQLQSEQQQKTWRQQFCTLVIDDKDFLHAEMWCRRFNFQVDRENCKSQLMVQIVHLKSRVRFHWTLPTTGSWRSDVCYMPNPSAIEIAQGEISEFGTTQVRLGLLSLLSTNAEELTHRLEFAENIVVPNDNGDSQFNIPVEAWKECQIELLEAIKQRDDDGSFALPASCPFQIDAIHYRNIRRWKPYRGNIVIEDRRVIRYAPALEPKKQELYNISVRSSLIDEEGMNLSPSEFFKEASAVNKYCRLVTETINQSRKTTH